MQEELPPSRWQELGGGGMKSLGLLEFRSSQERPCKLGFKSLGVAWEGPGQLPVVSLDSKV